MEEHGGGQLSDLMKNAIPLLSRVGVLAGGIVTLLTVFERVSGEIITAVEGFLLIAAVITSGLLVLGKTTKVVEDKSVKVPMYSQKQRRIASGILVVSSILLVAFAYRTGTDLSQRKSAGAGIAAATPAGTPLPTPTLAPAARRTAVVSAAQTVVAERALWPVVFSESFEDRKTTFGTGKGTDEFGTRNYTVNDGKYRAELKPNKPTTRWQMSGLKAISDMQVTVEARRVGGPSDSTTYGLVFRLVDNNNFYRFAIADDNRLFVQQYKDGKYLTLMGLKEVSAIRPGEMNRLTVSAQGSRFALFINDRYIDEIESKDFPSGQVGVTIGSSDGVQEAVFEFDNFEVRAP